MVQLHHTKKNEHGKKINKWQLVQLRCPMDESNLHDGYTDGNSHKSDMILKNNNEYIGLWLGIIKDCLDAGIKPQIPYPLPNQNKEKEVLEIIKQGLFKNI